MNMTRFRLIASAITVIGFVAIVFLPPMFATPSAIPSAAIPCHEMINVAWCIAITGTIFGLGLGLLIGSFLNLTKKEKAEPTPAGDVAKSAAPEE